MYNVQRRARKLYAALVYGHPSWETATWTEAIEFAANRFAQQVGASGKAARTEVSVGARGVLRLGHAHRDKPATLLWLQPTTGRRHQLRVHCSHHGHPIVGDVTYATDRLAYRTFLHAAALELPLSSEAGGAIVTATAPLRPLVDDGWLSHAFEAREEVREPSGWPVR